MLSSQTAITTSTLWPTASCSSTTCTRHSTTTTGPSYPWAATVRVWVAQFIKTTENLGYQHHGRALRISEGLAPQLLVARLAPSRSRGPDRVLGALR